MLLQHDRIELPRQTLGRMVVLDAIKHVQAARFSEQSDCMAKAAPAKT